MNITVRLFFIPFLLLVSSLQAQFTAGNLAVFRAESATSNNTNFSIVEINPLTANQASPVTTVTINGSAGSNSLRTSGSAGTTGYLSNSNDGSLLCFTAHNSTTTSGNANNILPRGVGTLNPAGTFALVASYTGVGGNQTRSATSINNSTWFVADQGGIYTGNSTVPAPTGNFRGIKSFGGTVYVFQANASLPPVSIVSAPAGGVITGLPGLANGNSNMQDFYMIASGNNGTGYDVLYVLSATTATAGIISKFSLVAGSWIPNGTYTTDFGGFGFAVAKSGTKADLYITTGLGANAANSVIKLTDDAAYNSTIAVTTANNTTLYTAPAGTTLKGIAFAPIAVPTPTVSALPGPFDFGTVTQGTFSAPQTFTLTASNLTPSNGTLTVTTNGADFQVFDGANWVNTTTINYSNNGATLGNIQARFSPQSAGALSGNLSITDGGLPAPTVITLSGTGNNNLGLTFNTVAGSPLNPPYVSGTINDAADPAATTGIALSVKETGTDISMADYSVSATSTNTTVVPVANVTFTKSNGSVLLKILPASKGYSDITVTLTKGTFTRNLVIHYAASTAATAGVYWPVGFADASAALALDDNYMVIANDETNFLYVFKRNASGLPVATFDFNNNNLLGLTDGSTGNWKELDLESAAPSPAVAGKSYWMGSMSNSSSFNDKPNRNRIFAITMNGTGAATTFGNAGYYAGLRAQLISWGNANGYNFSASAADGKDPKTIDGFNAEGMVFAPDNTTLYIAFRAPLVPTANRTNALIAPIQNFEAWFNNGAPSGNPIIGTPIELNLGGRGIRDIIRLSNGSYTIVAGSYGSASVPALYRWNGNPASTPVLLTSFNLTGLNAEAALGINEGGQVSAGKIQIICDNGDDVFYNDGIAAKDLSQSNFKKFSNQVVLSSAESLLPIYFEYVNAQRQPTGVQLNWKTGLQDDAGSFNIMRSEDGSIFTKIHTITVVPNQTVYSFIDLDAPVSKLYYRINGTDAAGKSFLSSVRTIAADGLREQTVKIYPNPVDNGSFSIIINKPGTKKISIYNSAGILYKQVEFGNTSKDVSTQGWAKGIYLLRITNNAGSISTEKIVVE